MAVGDDEQQAENAYYVYTLQRLGRALPGARVTFLLEYLERHPVGAHNRHVAERLERAMGDRTWLRSRSRRLVDEHPEAYKDIDQVIADQQDLVTVRHTLRQVLNYKGT